MSAPVAAMLLIAITIIASVGFYTYSVGLLGSVQKPPQHGSEILVIENIVFIGDACKVIPADCSANITVRNVGSIDSKIGAIYVDDVAKYGPNGDVLIAVGQAQAFTLPNVTSTQHNFRVATLNGSVFSTYGPQNIFIVGTWTRAVTTTLNSGSITTTSTYTTTISSTTTLYSTQVRTTSTSRSTTTTPVTTYTTTTRTRYYMTTHYGTTSTTSTRYYTTITTSSSTIISTSYFTTATGTTPTTTMTSPVTTVETTTITTTTSGNLSLAAVLLLVLLTFLPRLLGLEKKTALSRHQPRK
jgi:hypothetical protein